MLYHRQDDEPGLPSAHGRRARAAGTDHSLVETGLFRVGSVGGRRLLTGDLPEVHIADVLLLRIVRVGRAAWGRRGQSG